MKGGIVPVPSIAVINFSTQLDDREVQHAIRAVNRQVVEDFMPIWGAGRLSKLVAPVFDPADIDTLANDPVYADGVIYLVDEGLLQGALGFHDLNARDMPFGFVFILDPNDWTVTLSHEVLELIVDSTVNLFAPGPDPRDANNLVLHTYEVCDAVERTTYLIDGIAVSNFLTPSYFTIGDAVGTRNDFLGVGVDSFGLTQNSHIQFFDLAANDFVTVIGQQAIPERASRRFEDHAKAERPAEEMLQSTLRQYQKERPKGKRQGVQPPGLPGIEGLTRSGRYLASAQRLFGRQQGAAAP